MHGLSERPVAESSDGDDEDAGDNHLYIRAGKLIPVNFSAGGSSTLMEHILSSLYEVELVDPKIIMMSHMLSLLMMLSHK